VWWLASPVAAESNYFCFVNNNGNSNNNNANNEFGIAPDLDALKKTTLYRALEGRNYPDYGAILVAL